MELLNLSPDLMVTMSHRSGYTSSESKDDFASAMMTGNKHLGSPLRDVSFTFTRVPKAFYTRVKAVFDTTGGGIEPFVLMVSGGLRTGVNIYGNRLANGALESWSGSPSSPAKWTVVDLDTANNNTLAENSGEGGAQWNIVNADGSGNNFWVLKQGVDTSVNTRVFETNYPHVLTYDIIETSTNRSRMLACTGKAVTGGGDAGSVELGGENYLYMPTSPAGSHTMYLAGNNDGVFVILNNDIGQTGTVTIDNIALNPAYMVVRFQQKKGMVVKQRQGDYFDIAVNCYEVGHETPHLTERVPIILP